MFSCLLASECTTDYDVIVLDQLEYTARARSQRKVPALGLMYHKYIDLTSDAIYSSWSGVHIEVAKAGYSGQAPVDL